MRSGLKYFTCGPCPFQHSRAQSARTIVLPWRSCGFRSVLTITPNLTSLLQEAHILKSNSFGFFWAFSWITDHRTTSRHLSELRISNISKVLPIRHALSVFTCRVDGPWTRIVCTDRYSARRYKCTSRGIWSGSAYLWNDYSVLQR